MITHSSVLINLWMQARQRIEEDASAFFSKHRSVSSDTGYRLQTALFALTGTCTLVLAFGSVKLIRECDSHTLVVIILRKGGGGSDAVCRHGIMLGMKDVVGGQGYTQRIVLQERLGEAEIDYPHRFLLGSTLFELRYIGSLHIDEPTLRQGKGIVEDEIPIRVIPIVVDTDGFKIGIPERQVDGSLWLPKAKLGS